MTKTIALSLRFFRTLSLISIIFLLVFYIFQVTGLAKDHYLLKESQSRLTNLTQAKEGLEIDFSKVKSLANLEGYLFNQDFEKAQKTKYIQIYSPLVKQ